MIRKTSVGDRGVEIDLLDAHISVKSNNDPKKSS